MAGDSLKTVGSLSALAFSLYIMVKANSAKLESVIDCCTAAFRCDPICTHPGSGSHELQARRRCTAWHE